MRGSCGKPNIVPGMEPCEPSHRAVLELLTRQMAINGEEGDGRPAPCGRGP